MSEHALTGLARQALREAGGNRDEAARQLRQRLDQDVLLKLELLNDLISDEIWRVWGEDKAITLEQIQRKVGDFFNLELTELTAKTRTRAVTFPRQIAMYLARQLTNFSLYDVGRAFGKDHTTVLHAVDKIERLLENDLDLRKTIDGLIQSLTAAERFLA